MEQDLEKRLAALEQKIDATYKEAHRTQLYMKWTAIITIAMIVLPLIGLAFVIPQYLNTLNAFKLFSL